MQPRLDRRQPPDVRRWCVAQAAGLAGGAANLRPIMPISACSVGAEIGECECIVGSRAALCSERPTARAQRSGSALKRRLAWALGDGLRVSHSAAAGLERTITPKSTAWGLSSRMWGGVGVRDAAHGGRTELKVHVCNCGGMIKKDVHVRAHRSLACIGTGRRRERERLSLDPLG